MVHSLHFLGFLMFLFSGSQARPRVEVELSRMEVTLAHCEAAIVNCCTEDSTPYKKVGQCFEKTNCAGINFTVNPCGFFSQVLGNLPGSKTRPRVEVELPRVEVELPRVEVELPHCEEAIVNCCTEDKTPYRQVGRCFEKNKCAGINFIVNPCGFLPQVLGNLLK